MNAENAHPEDVHGSIVIERVDDVAAAPPAKWLGAGGTCGPVYVVRCRDDVLWTIGIDFGDASHVPFREELFWEAAGVVVIGGGNVVYAFDAQRGDLRAKVDVPCYFGHLARAPIPTEMGTAEDLLFILGWTDVYAMDVQLGIRWVAKNVAVDGIVFSEVRDGAVIVSAEMDPPGGWVDVALDLLTGAVCTSLRQSNT